MRFKTTSNINSNSFAWCYWYDVNISNRAILNLVASYMWNSDQYMYIKKSSSKLWNLLFSYWEKKPNSKKIVKKKNISSFSKYEINPRYLLFQLINDIGLDWIWSIYCRMQPLKQMSYERLNETLNVATIHKLKELSLNGATYESHPIDNMIIETLTRSALTLHNGSDNNTVLEMIEDDTVLNAYLDIGSTSEPLTVLILVTICYAFIFIAGILGNVITCAVIYQNKSMHTATNYYLFNLAISDLTLLLSGKWIMSINRYYQKNKINTKW